MKIAVVGAGFTGLTAAYRLTKKGHQVTVFEKEKLAGGLAAGFKEKNWDWSLEFFYHHLFTSDNQVSKLLEELSLENKLFYTRPKTSSFYKNRVTQFDSPLSLIKFPYLSIPEKARTGLVTLYLKTLANWHTLEGITAYEWLKKYYGKRSFETLWQPLLVSKFGDFAKDISMAWFWARIKKRSIKLGYLKGGFQVLIDRLVEKIKENGGKILLGQEIKNFPKITSDGGRLIRQLAEKHDSSEVNVFDKIIITTPTQLFFPKINAPKMLGALNLILFLTEKFLTDETYWLNIIEPGFPFVAVVEHTNLVNPARYGGNHILYVGGYYPPSHRYFKMDSGQILKEFLPFLQKINPEFQQSTISNQQLATNLHAQPLIPLNYSKIIPPHKTPIPNVYLANIQQVYPWDRGVNYAIDLGNKIAQKVE